MQPHCNLQDHFEHVSRIPLKKQLQLRALRDARQSRRRKRACVRRGIPTYHFRRLERPRRERRRRVATPFYNNACHDTQIERVLFGFEVSCRAVQRLSFRRCARMTFKAQKPRPRSFPTPPPCAYPQTAGFSAHDSPAPHRAGLRARDDLRLWPRSWGLFRVYSALRLELRTVV